jgi:hypothetical protein
MGYLKKVTNEIFKAIEDMKNEKALQFDGTNNDGLFIGPKDRQRILHTVMQNMRGTCNPREIISLIDMELDT